MDEAKKMTSQVVELDKVIEDERELIDKRRKRLYPTHPDDTSKSGTSLVGLALSGGGIRSAVTNLGILYEMSRVGLFRIVDYLSTVSGGGYIGCCLSSLLSLKKIESDSINGDRIYTYEEGDKEPASLFSSAWNSFPFRDLPSDIPIDGLIDGQPKECEHGTTPPLNIDDKAYCRKFSSRDQVFHLRDRASYLVPSTLPFGSHFIRMMGAVSATTILSLTWFISLLFFITTIYILISFPSWDDQNVTVASNKSHFVEKCIPSDSESIMTEASVALCNIKKRLILQLHKFSAFTPAKWIVLFLGILWGFLAPFCMHLYVESFKVDQTIGEDVECYLARQQLKCISIVTVSLLFLVLVVSYSIIDKQPSIPDPRLLFPVVFAFGCFSGSLILLCLMGSDFSPFCHANKNKDAGPQDGFGFNSGLAWNRISRTELSLSTGIFICWLVVSYLFAILPAFILSWDTGYIALVLAITILVFRYYFAREKKKIEDLKHDKFRFILVQIRKWLIGPLAFFFVLLAIIGIAGFLGEKCFGENWQLMTETGNIKNGNIIYALSVAGIAGFLSLVMSFLNFNNLSPHVFYKDRLAEAFLATFLPCTKKDKETGYRHSRMDLARNSVEMHLADLHGNQIREGGGKECAARGPYLLINATLNLTGARDLKGFRRQSENFLFSRCYTGSNRTGFLATDLYNPPVKLGRAMAISGASVSSIMGTFGSLAESFACTIVGVRLGYWLRNPLDMDKSKKKRSWNWRNLYCELFRYTNSRGSHVYLSDGGHSGDNLGLLALLERRTKLIIASDAECDPEYMFNSLNNSIRRAYVDYNIKVHITLDGLKPNKDKNNFTQKHIAMGRILYPDRPWQKSWLLVIKNTMTGKESSPIRNYKKKSSEFPHETTADQFFTEEQFEVYRSLGREACREIWSENINIFRSKEWRQNPWACIDEFCHALSKEKHEWDDVISAIWHSEIGDFDSWEGFQKTIEAMNRSHNKDDSMMVKQLQELHTWLIENKENFNLVKSNFDVPKTWSQFEEIRYSCTYLHC